MKQTPYVSVIAGILTTIASFFGLVDLPEEVITSIAVALVGIGMYVIGKRKSETLG